MSVADKARKVVQDLTGMWWPDADEDGLREAALAWRAFAEDVDDIAAASNKAALTLIEDNKGESIDAFDKFWRRYYDHGRGWMKDLPDAARDMAKALDAYADAVHGAKKHLEHELEIVSATLVAGTALAVFTAGLSEGAAAAAAAGVTELAASLGVAVTEEVAAIAGTALATAAFGGVESITVDLAVAQPTAIALGEQKSGINLDEARQAGLYGALLGGVLAPGQHQHGAMVLLASAGGNSVRTGPALLPRMMWATKSSTGSSCEAVGTGASGSSLSMPHSVLNVMALPCGTTLESSHMANLAVIRAVWQAVPATTKPL